MTDALLFYFGALTLALSILFCLIAALLLRLKQRQLHHQLTEEYGLPPKDSTTHKH